MTRYLRAEFVLPLTIVGAASMVAISEFLTTFEFTAGGEPQAVSMASDRHSYALLILAVLTVAGMAYAMVTGLRAAAIGTACIGLATLLLFLVLDLPDAGKAGPLDDDAALFFANAKAEPDTGFWLEAIGSVVLGLATVAFATLSSSQLRAWPELIASRRAARKERQDDPEPDSGKKEKRAARAEEASEDTGGAEGRENGAGPRKRPARERQKQAAGSRSGGKRDADADD